MNWFRSLHPAAQGQRFRPGQLEHGSEPCLAQFGGPATGVPADQADEPCCFPDMAPVVDRLMTDTAPLTNRWWMFALAQHQQSRCPQSCIPQGMIDR